MRAALFTRATLGTFAFLADPYAIEDGRYESVLIWLRCAHAPAASPSITMRGGVVPECRSAGPRNNLQEHSSCPPAPLLAHTFPVASEDSLSAEGLPALMLKEEENSAAAAAAAGVRSGWCVLLAGCHHLLTTLLSWVLPRQPQVSSCCCLSAHDLQHVPQTHLGAFRMGEAIYGIRCGRHPRGCDLGLLCET